LSHVSPLAGNSVHAAIARAAERTGVDFDYLLAQAKIESSLDPAARARTSSAAGLYQFTRSTWLETLEKHGPEHGLGGAAGPNGRAEIMALRFDPQASALMAAELASDNRAELTPLLGREPDAAELYLGHFLGIGGARQFLAALQDNPGQSAAAVLPRAAAANRGIFFEPGGAPRSVGAVMELIRSKVEAAMGNDFLPSASGGGLEASNWTMRLPDNPGPNPSPQGEGLAPSQRPSMADTLRNTFGLGASDKSTPGFVRTAYGQLRSMGL
jgi:Transglycosylase SLT domain